MKPWILQCAWLLGCSATVAGAHGDGTPDGGRADVVAQTDIGVSQAPAARPLSPLSTSWLTADAPLLRWQPASGPTRVEVCADRACARIEYSALIEGDSVTTPALAAGVHFWRVSPQGPVWEFFVGGARRGVTGVTGFIHDYDGDGRPDLAVTDPAPRWRHFQFHANRASGFSAIATRTISLIDSVIESVVTVEPAGDVNGDGYLDVLATINQQGGSFGAVMVFEGGPDGPAQAEIGLWPARYNLAAAAAGDVSGDGYADLILTRSDGVQTVIEGRPRGQMLASRPAPLPVDTQGFPESWIASAGDALGDGRWELFRLYNWPGVLAAPGRDAWPDSLRIEYGTQRDELFAGPRLGGFTHSVVDARPLGDVNGDGRVDVAVCTSPEDLTFPDAAEPWRALVFPGRALAAMRPSLPMGAFEDPAPGSAFRPTLRAVGDVNADGYDDVTLVSYQGTTLRLSYGSPMGVSQSGAGVTLVLPDGYTVYSHGAIGDQDGDGVADVCVIAQRLGGGGVDDGAIRHAFFFRGSRAGVATRPTLELARMP